MRVFKSKFAVIIQEYLEHKKMLGYTNFEEHILARFDTYCYEYFPESEILTKEVLRNYINYEISNGKEIKSKATALRLLAQYIVNGAYILPRTVLPSKPQFAPYILSDDELSRLFNAVDNLQSKTSNSVKLMFPTFVRLFYTCGLRPREVRLLKRDNINFKTGEILIEKTKGNKERIVVMSDDMLLQCCKYDVIRAIAITQSPYFFVREDDSPLTIHQVERILNQCWKQANPNTPVNMLPRLRPYDLRHRFASAILQKWINENRDLYAMLPYLRAFMGHEKISHTAYYIHLLPESLLCSSGVDWSKIDDVNPEVSVWEN